MKSLGVSDINRILRYGEAMLALAGIDSPGQDALVLLCKVAGCSRLELFMETLTLTEADEDRYRDLIEKRATRYPLQYIIGKEQFMDVELMVDERVLIPRPETELLIEKVAENCRKRLPEWPKIADIGTGSGNIAISLTKNLTHCTIMALDISEGALRVAKENAERNGVGGRVSFYLCDIMAGYPAGKGEPFDIVVSNPPYIRSSEIDSLQAEVKYESRLFLDGGEDGLDFYKKIVGVSGGILRPGGHLFFEVGYDQAGAVDGIIRESGLFGAPERFKDHNGVERVIAAQRVRH